MKKILAVVLLSMFIANCADSDGSTGRVSNAVVNLLEAITPEENETSTGTNGVSNLDGPPANPEQTEGTAEQMYNPSGSPGIPGESTSGVTNIYADPVN